MALVYDVEGSTLTLNGRRFTDFQEGDTLVMEFPNPATSKRRGVQGNYNVSKTSNGDEMNLTINLLKASGDDAFFNGLLNQELPVVLDGSFQASFVRDNVDGIDSYDLQGGTITTKPTHTTNTIEGNDLMAYVINFASARRSV